MTKSTERIRETAGKILEGLANGEIPQLPGTNKQVLKHAYVLLKFEGLVKSNGRICLTATGEKHIKKYGYRVYPRLT